MEANILAPACNYARLVSRDADTQLTRMYSQRLAKLSWRGLHTYSIAPNLETKLQSPLKKDSFDAAARKAENRSGSYIKYLSTGSASLTQQMRKNNFLRENCA